MRVQRCLLIFKDVIQQNYVNYFAVFRMRKNCVSEVDKKW